MQTSIVRQSKPWLCCNCQKECKECLKEKIISTIEDNIIIYNELENIENEYIYKGKRIYKKMT